MRASIQVVDIVYGTKPLGVKRSDLARYGIDFLRDAQIGRSAPDVIRRVLPALPLGQRLDRRFPRVGSHPSRVVDRQPQIIAKFRPSDALGLILMEPRRPFTAEINLGESRKAYDKRSRQNEQARSQSRWIHALNFTTGGI